jgi:hypothetical protein
MHPIAPFARVAFAHGVAISGGPITERVKAGCIAAVRVAIDHADDPDVLEATLQLGALEGTWALVYDRREQLHTDTDAKLMAIWAEVATDLDLPEMVRQVRRHAGLGEAFNPATAAMVAVVTGLVLQMLRGLLRKPAWSRLRQAVQDAIATARAEGQAAAIAIAANAANRVMIDFDIAFDDAYAALASASSLMTDADTWLHNLIGDTADAVGRRLADLAANGAPYEDLLAAAEDLVTGSNARAVSSAVDLLTSRALSQGALDLYAREGVTEVDFLTAGDGRVCPRCTDAEAKNPYTPGNAPVPGLHPYCRCAVAARTSLPESLVSQYSTATTATER